MSKWVTYEWDIETVEADAEDPEILDHRHADRLSELTPADLEPDQPGTAKRLVLVRDDDNISGERLWAYVRGGKLPPFFENAWGCDANVMVPKRFRDEFDRWMTKHGSAT